MTPDAAFVLTEQPVPLEILPLEDDRTPDGMVCLGTRIRGRLVARCVVAGKVVCHGRQLILKVSAWVHELLAEIRARSRELACAT